MTNEKIPNENLHRIIRERVNLGHDIVQIKEHLLNRGYSHSEIHDAIDSVFNEVKEFENEAEHTLKDSFKPTPLKFILPFIFIVLLLPHLLINYMVLPEVGADVCSIVRSNSNLKELLKVPEAKENIKLGIAALQKKELDLETKVADRLRLAVNVNFPFKVSSAYKLDPYFPLPCESDIFESKNCRFYIAQKDYECIAKNNNESVALEIIGSPAREYSPVSFGEILLHSILVMAALYAIAAFFSHFHKKSKKHLANNWKKAIEIVIVVFIVLGIITAILIYFLTLKTLTQ